MSGTVPELQLAAVFQSVETAPTQEIFFALASKVVVACRPDCDPVAVTKKVTSRSPSDGANDVFVIVPLPSATAVSTVSGCTRGWRCRTMVTVSPGVQPLPVSVTVSPGA